MTLHGTPQGSMLYSESRFPEETRAYWSCKTPAKCTFRVIHCLEHSYVKSWFSRRKSGKIPPMAATAPTTSGYLHIDGVHISKMLVGPLRKALTDRGLSSVGRRTELRERLLKVTTAAIDRVVSLSYCDNTCLCD